MALKRQIRADQLQNLLMFRVLIFNALAFPLNFQFFIQKFFRNISGFNNHISVFIAKNPCKRKAIMFIIITIRIKLNAEPWFGAGKKNAVL
jgi:hypothetical protein